MSEVKKMEYVKAEDHITVLASAANSFGIKYVGVKKPKLAAEINAKIDQVNAGEIEHPELSAGKEVVEQPTTNEVQNQVEEKTEQDQNTTTETPAKAAAAPKEKKERTVRAKAKKWFEEEGAFPYKAGDVVEIVNGKDLVGRKLQVIEPSAKKDMVKGRLIHPVTGGLQGTVIAIAFERIQLLESADSIAEQEPTEVNDNQDGVNEVEEVVNETEDQEVTEVLENETSITAGSEEEVDIPLQEEEVQDQDQEEKAE